MLDYDYGKFIEEDKEVLQVLKPNSRNQRLSHKMPPTSRAMFERDNSMDDKPEF